MWHQELLKIVSNVLVRRETEDYCIGRISYEFYGLPFFFFLQKAA